jgi:hypothetical protein
MKRVDSLIKNGTGYSSKNFALVLSVLLAVFLIVNVVAWVWVDLLLEKTISTDLMGLGAMVTAVAGVLGFVYRQKVNSEKYEIRDHFGRTREEHPREEERHI